MSADTPLDHTFDELYGYRKAFNALLFNEWARLGLYDVHKSFRHSDKAPCFGGGWFIVVAQTPEGQISNHYKTADWDLFQLPNREYAAEYDGHTPQVALQRMLALAASREPQEPPADPIEAIREELAGRLALPLFGATNELDQHAFEYHARWMRDFLIRFGKTRASLPAGEPPAKEQK